MSLATKYRPAIFEEMLGQQSIIRILEKQVALQTYTNCYLFTGNSGVGKTTICRAFSKLINKGRGEPIEIDAASNNGVDNVREIINSANERAIDGEYKIFIVDEAHAISQAGWNAFLKCIEEPPKYTIFMFCTTNPEKIPATIINRTMRFNLSKIPTDKIKARLEYICEQEHYTNYKEACDYIAKLANGGARDAISLLEKAAGYDTDLNIKNVLECLGNFSYDTLFDFTSMILNADEAGVLQVIEDYTNSGKDIKIFIDNYLKFLLDLCKFLIFGNLSLTGLPISIEPRCEGYSHIPNILDLTEFFADFVLDVKNTIKNDTTAKTTVEIYLLKLIRECQKRLGD